MQLATEDVGYFPRDRTIYLYCYDEEDHSWAVEAADAITTDTMPSAPKDTPMVPFRVAFVR
ncbi:hypothetical protein CBOM_03085 [Ceraceosorus bombacis]|uniref:Uncharacterized protein n=1 Tax=Ceraceosorus bombacis TaxID=401625 RepID=A0A0N7LAM6_9BASI|nr:hypothetical protein CBOM_03085 [Ceraceosorus bombacis]